MQKVSIARKIAFEALKEVMFKGKMPDEVLESQYAQYGENLKRIDRNFAKEITYGCLRWWSKIYWILQNTSSRKLDTCSEEVRIALVAGTYQIFYLDRVPERAAVNESVEYVRENGQKNAVPFVNGILRQIARRAAYFPKPDKEKAPVEYLSLQFAHPPWLVNRWISHINFAKLEVLLKQCNQPPPYTVRVNSLKTPLEQISDFQNDLLRLERCKSDRRPLRSALHLEQAPDTSAGSIFDQGFYTIQGESSQLIAPLLQPKPGDFVVDACAGPGGKLTHLYELGRGEIRLLATEKDPSQMRKAKENATRLGIQDIQWQEIDFLDLRPDTPPDRILLDAPCTGLGVLRRHPEGKWLKKPDIIPIMAERQRKLLLHAIEILKPGGEIVYSVCSFEPEETTHQLEWLIANFSGKIEVLSPMERLQDYYKKYVTRNDVFLVYSGNPDGMDGFGAFIIKKL